MKKTIAIILIAMSLISIYVPTVNGVADVTTSQLNQLMDSGTADVPTSDGTNQTSTITKNTANNSGNNSKGVVTSLIEILIMLPKALNFVMSLMALNLQTNYVNPVNNKKYSIFTIQELLMGKYDLFDINFFENKAEGVNANIINKMKNNVAIWYVSIRNIAIVGSAIVLIYVGIRLALAISKNEPSATAKYKSMVLSWLIGFILLFVLHYIIRIMLYANDLLISIIRRTMEDGTIAGMEKSIMTNTFEQIMSARGMDKLLYAVIYFMLTWYQIKFFMIYLKRVLETYFLVIISPLVCMLYSVDKIGDNRSQSFSVWFKALAENIFIQPIQLFIFVVFVYSASELATIAPIIAILFLAALSNGEKIIKLIFGLGGKNLKDIKLPKFQKPKLPV